MQWYCVGYTAGMEIQMQQMPAACGSCGYLYPSGYYFDLGGTGIGASAAVFENAQVTVPCPMCGRHRGSVLANEYVFVKHTITLLQAPERTAEEREQIEALLHKAREEHVESVAEIQERADREAPEPSALIGKLLAEKPADMKVATCSILLTNTLGKLAAIKGNGSTNELEPSEVVYDSVNEYNVTTVQAPSATKVGRNDPCPCGSGKKFKKCHGDPTKKVAAL